MFRLAGSSLILIFLVANCGETTTEPPLPFMQRTIYRDDESAFDLQRAEIVTSEQQWREVWDDVFPQWDDVPPLPSVDFSEESVVLAATGSLPDTCYLMRIASIDNEAGHVTVTVKTWEMVGCICHFTEVTPVEIVAVNVPGAEGSFEFLPIEKRRC